MILYFDRSIRDEVRKEKKKDHVKIYEDGEEEEEEKKETAEALPQDLEASTAATSVVGDDETGDV